MNPPGAEGDPPPAAALAALLDEARERLAAGRAADAESLLAEAVAKYPDSAPTWNELGRSLNNLRRLADAERAFREAVRSDPGMAAAWNNLGHVLRAAGHAQDAHGAFARAVELDPGDGRARRNLAMSFLARGEIEAGIAALEQALESDPEDALAHAQLAHALQAGEQPAGARRHYEAALALRPELTDAAAGLGALHQAEGRYADAGQRYRQVLATDPAHPMARAGLAAILEIEGRYEAGLALLEPRLGDASLPASVADTAARLYRRLGRQPEAMAMLDSVDASRFGPADAALLDYTRGGLLEDAGDHAGAFEAFRRANSRLPGTFDPPGFRRTIDRLIGFFDRERFAATGGAGNESSQPLFIVGMPRSGTSLVEQMFASHSRVLAGGERTELFAFVRELCDGDTGRWPDAVASQPPGRLAALATRYLAVPGAGDALRMTDKMPANFLNLGLAALLFPNARVIWCRRDPLDTGLSCYCQNFLSEGMAFARRLEDIGLYQQGCLRLMNHWLDALPLPIQIVDYEELVNDFEAGARRLVAFAGLDWEAACLRPDRSDRVVATASYAQVRRPVYASSVGKSRRYERELAPLSQSLAAPWDD